MKRCLSILLALLLLASCPLSAVEIEPDQTTGRRLQRAFTNIALAPMEVSTELAREKSKQGGLEQLEPSWLWALPIGVLKAGVRVLAGTYEIVTSPIPYPHNYEWKQDEEFAWELLDEVPKEVNE